MASSSSRAPRRLASPVGLLILCSVAWLHPRLAHGQFPASSASTLAEAKKLYQAGARAHKLGDFQQALTHFRAALKLTSRPSIIFAMAQCHRLLGQDKKALFYYRLYLSEWEKRNPDKPAPSANEVKAYVATLQARIEAKRKADAELERKRRLALVPQPTSAPIAPEPKPAFYERWWFWTALGTAVVAGITTAAILAAQPADAVKGSLGPGQVQLELGGGR